MTTATRLFPTPAQVEAATPGDRDRAIDVIRIVALAGWSALGYMNLLVGWGLKDAGIYCVAVMLVALVAARALARPLAGAGRAAISTPGS